MSASFESWGKRIVFALLVLLCQQNICAQSEKLSPELDVTFGLQSNTVKAVKTDDKGRIWIGTDYGLDIHNDNTAAQKIIKAAVVHRSIQAIEFFDSLVFIGTAQADLFLFNRFTGNLYKHYGPDEISPIRKFKIFKHLLFMLGEGDPYLWKNGSLNKLPLTSGINGDYLVDMFQYDDELYGLASPSKQIVKFKKQAFEENCNALFFKGNKQLYAENYTSAVYHNNKLFLGSGGNAQSLLIIEKNKPPVSLDFLKSLGAGYMVWEMAWQKDKIILAIGDTISNKKGLLCILNSDYSYTSIKAADYITCMTLDSINNTLIYGTSNNGLFLQSGIGGSMMIDKPTECNIVANNTITFIYSDEYFEKLNTTAKQGPVKNNKIYDIISAMSVSGDTLVYANAHFIKGYKASSLKPLFAVALEQTATNSKSITVTERVNKSIFVFYTNGPVLRYNIDTKKSELISNVSSHNPDVFKMNDKIIFLNKDQGFYVVSEKEGYPLACTDTSIHFINDFTISNDILYALFKDEVKEYAIDFRLHQLRLLNSYSTYSSLVDVIGIRWILSGKNNLYIVNDNGIMKMSLKMTPVSYFYFGSYNQIKKPVIVGDSLLISTNNSLTKFALNELERPRDYFDPKDVSIVCPESVFENAGFKISIGFADYFMQDHSLKTLEIWRNGKLVSVKYTKFSEFDFDDGLPNGDYRLLLKIGNYQSVQRLKITLPLNKNPLFIGTCVLALLIVSAFIIKSNIDKRKMKKRLLENKLQNLKQNLNPHFVYNSMNLISSMILEEKYDEAIQVVSDFSRLQRTYLETNNKEKISVAEELEFLDAYLKLQQQRFNEDIDFKYIVTHDVAIDLTRIMVPPLILQPIAENALKYGILASSHQNRIIKITVNKNNSHAVLINIEDNGENVDHIYHGLGMGQNLVQERIELFNISNTTNLKITFGKPPVYSATGYRVELVIPA